MRRALLFCVAGATLALSACGGGDGESSAFGEPGQRGEVDRTVEIHMLDGRRFEPASVTVQKGQTVTFKVMNMDDELHEFDLGDKKFQKEMAKEMEGMPAGHRMADEPNAISVRAGETRELTWTFSKEGTFEYMCHQMGHSGTMKGRVTVS